MILIQEIEPKEVVLKFYNQYHRQLFCQAVGLCKQFNKDETYANDLLQGLYLKIQKSSSIVLKGYEKRGVRYLFTMMKNELLNIVKKEKSWKRQEELYCRYKQENTTKGEAGKIILFAELKDMMKKNLSIIDYEIMKYYIEGYKIKEIAVILEINPSTVGVKIYRTKEKLESFF